MRKLVLAGGALQDDNAEVYGTIVELAGGVGKAKIGIITAASEPEEAEANGAFYCELFKDGYGALGAEWISIDLHRIANNSALDVLRQLDSMTAFFFGGGDQSKLVSCFLNADHTDTPALALIRSRFEKGALVAGTSAGAVIQSAGPMVTGGVGADDVTWEARGGIGFFPFGLLDSHFSERDRLERMLHIGAATGWNRVFGLDEGTALVVAGDRAFVLGENRVVVAEFDTNSGVRVRHFCSGDLVTL